MHVLPRMNVMLDLIFCNIGERENEKKNLSHMGIPSHNPVESHVLSFRSYRILIL